MGITYPVDETAFSSDQFRRVFGTALNGIVDDYSGTSFQCTASGETITVAPGRAVVQGTGFTETATTTLNLRNFGTSQPAVGQSRVDEIVLRYDPTGQTTGTGSSTAIISVNVHAGVVTASTSQLAPSLTASADGVWELSLARCFRTMTTAGAQVTIRDERIWLGLSVWSGGFGNFNAFPIGTRARNGALDYVLGVDAAGNRSLTNVTPTGQSTAITLINLGQGGPFTGRTDQWAPPTYSVVGNLVTLQGKLNFGSNITLPAATPVPFGSIPAIYAPSARLSFGVLPTLDANQILRHWRIEVDNTGTLYIRDPTGDPNVFINSGTNFDVSGISFLHA